MVSGRWKRRILVFCLAGLAVHALFDPLAMVLYPGGTSIDEDAEGYSFFENFYSDLGMAQTYGGEANTLSLLLWASVNALNGIALVFFSVIMPSYFTGTRLERFSSRVGSICGVLAGISSVGAVVPWDLYLIAHLVFTFGTSALFLLAFAFYSVAMLKNRRYPNVYAAVFAVYLVIIGAYFGLAFFGRPDVGTREGLVIVATGQKIVVYSGFVTSFVQYLGVLDYHRRHSGCTIRC
jgi:hypothetical protein